MTIRLACIAQGGVGDWESYPLFLHGDGLVAVDLFQQGARRKPRQWLSGVSSRRKFRRTTPKGGGRSVFRVGGSFRKPHLPPRQRPYLPSFISVQYPSGSRK
jgi:hypothetical protein